MLERNSQDKARCLINNEVFFSGTLEVYKRIQFAQISWNVFNLVISIDLKIPRVSQGPDFCLNYSEEKENVFWKKWTQLLPIKKYPLYSSLIETEKYNIPPG